ncbi:hypothetical protein Plo01_43190 [Planobispora longispora]|uniref:Uncharacterized protein n=1 Tax=Planobispora longispora TaxID=28887 RepID=A0A8J3RNH5_9ACTN|nr:hypothetical protein Plo01_43190 [Planobispora longispora]
MSSVGRGHDRARPPYRLSGGQRGAAVAPTTGPADEPPRRFHTGTTIRIPTPCECAAGRAAGTVRAPSRAGFIVFQTLQLNHHLSAVRISDPERDPACAR